MEYAGVLANISNLEDIVNEAVLRGWSALRRGKHFSHVFTYNGRPVSRMNATAWRKARERVDLVQVRVHDLKHTFGRRLRSVGVSFEDRQDLLGHRSGRITTHYSSAELQNLFRASNKICDNSNKQSGVVLTLLRSPTNRSVTEKKVSKLGLA